MKIHQWFSVLCFLVSQPALAADPFIAENAPDLGLYLAISGGWNHADGDEFEVPSIPVSGEIFFNDGWKGSVALGAHITENIRTEIEFAARRNSLDDQDIVGVGTFDLDGHTNVYTGLLKAAYDFGEGPFRPYIGIGAGIAEFNVEIPGGSDSTLAFAGAVNAGVSYELTANAELFADAEVLLLEDVSLDPANTGSADLSNPMFVSASLGLRWKF